MPLDRVPPSDEIRGAAILPLARIKRILSVDDEINGVSANATFAIAIATEMFIRYFAEQAMTVVKSEKKPRKTVLYKDLAYAVSRIDNLTFLEDIVPRTTTYREYKKVRKAKARKANAEAAENSGEPAVGDAPPPQADTTTNQDAGAVPTEGPVATGEPRPLQQPQTSPKQSRLPNGQQLIFQLYAPNVSSTTAEPGDVQMG